MSPDADGGQLLTLVVLAGRADGGRDAVGDRADGERVVEQVTPELDGRAEGTVTEEDQAEHELADEGLGDREGKQDALVVGSGGKGLVEGRLRLSGLLVNELAADVVFLGQLGNGLRSGEGVHGETLTWVGGKLLSGAGRNLRQGPGGRGGVRMG